MKLYVVVEEVEYENKVVAILQDPKNPAVKVIYFHAFDKWGKKGEPTQHNDSNVLGALEGKEQNDE